MCGAREATCLGWGNTDVDFNPNTLLSAGSGRGAAVCFGGELRVCAAYSPPILERTRTRMQAALERSLPSVCSRAHRRQHGSVFARAPTCMAES